MKKLFTLICILISLVSFSQSTTVVISQAYGGGGGTTGTYLYDYIELHNVSGVTQSLTGFSLQYGSGTGNFGSVATNVYAFPVGTSIPAGGYFLIQLSNAGTAGIPLPVTPDLVTTNLTMSGTSGKVALATQATALGCGATATTCTLPAANIIDLVSYGASNNAEGGTTVNNGVALTSTQGAVRKLNGCQDTDNNNNDFNVVTAPIPRNSASAAVNCVAVAPSLTVTGTLTNFGNVFIGSTSASQSYLLSGSNLTGAPGVITIVSPSVDFEVSNNNIIWGATTTIAYTSSTLAPTQVWVRFAPQSAGLKTGNVSNTGGGVSVAVNVAVSGTGVTPPTPVLSATGLVAFGNVCVNTISGPNSFTVNGVNLTTANITVGPLNGFSFSTTATGVYSPSLTLVQTGGTFSQQIFVKFTPTAIQSYNGNIIIAGGGASSINVAASGAGNNNPPSLTTSAASAITTSSATLTGNINSAGCTAVTSYGFEYSLVNGFINGTVVISTNLTAGSFTANLSSLSPSTTYYYKAFAINAGGTGYSVQSSFTTANPIITATALTSFGAVCTNTISAANSFVINSTGLASSNVNVGPLAGYSFSTTANGTYTTTLSLPQPGGPYSQTIFVKLSPVAVQNYNGNIVVSGGGAASINVPVTGSGINTAATVITKDSVINNSNSVTINGEVINGGCTNITERGFIYSSIPGLANSLGNKILAPLTGSFSTTLYALVQNSKYYYKAYAINAAGIAYGAEKSFTTSSIPEGLKIYSTPALRGSNIHITLKGIKPGHYAAKIINRVGQIVYKKDMILQVDFIDDYIMIPGHLPFGAYTLKVESLDFETSTSFMIL